MRDKFKTSPEKFSLWYKNHKRLSTIIGIVALVLLFVGIVISPLFSAQLSPYSVKVATPARSYFNLNSEKGVLYKAKSQGRGAVDEFLKNGAPVNGQGKLLPADFSDNSKINKVTKDSDLNPEIISNSSSKEHYSFSQSINGIKIYGASFIVHLQNNNEVYSVSGNIVTSKEVTKQNISDTKAVEIAAESGREEAGFPKDITVTNVEKVIVNFKILGLKDDPVNYLSESVQIDSEEGLFSKRYFVSLTNGKIIYSENLNYEVQNRRVYGCNGTSNPTGCSLARGEGGAVTGEADADNLYNYMGEIYGFYKNNFNRDGLDGIGGALEGYVKIYSYKVRTSPTTVVTKYCSTSPNAYHTSAGYMAYCPGTVVKDVTAHEFGHGVVGSTVSLNPGNQYGALNESIADSFASALDGNWTIGEGSIFGIIRNLSNPPSIFSQKYQQAQPDRLFSSGYNCSEEEVHHNAGVQNKSFYLMAAGGSFNGCTVSGIGIEKSQQILYKVLASQYLPQTANFYDMYSGVNKACADLYGSGSPTCKEVKKAYEATEMDQQPAGLATGAKCGGRTAKPQASCVGEPTSVPVTPTVIQSITPNPTTTLTPSVNVLPTPTLAPNVTPSPTPRITLTATPTPSITPSPTVAVSPLTPTPTLGVFQRRGTPTPTPSQYYTCAPDPNCAKNNSIQLCPLICTPVQN